MRVRLALFAALAVAVAASLVFFLPRPAPPVEGETEEEGDGPDEPTDWFFRQRAFPVGTLDHAAYLRARRDVAARQRSGGPAWTFAGPTNVGGRVTSLAVETFDRFYVGTASGGVLRTTDGGQTYTTVGESDFALAIGDVALDPNDAQTVWVGTGEANPGGGSLTYGGSGIYRSRDGGATWASLGLEESGAIGRIVIDPTNADRVWVAAIGKQFAADEHRGVFRTLDGGQTWQKTLFVDGETGAIDLAIDPRDPNRLYAATWTRQRRPNDRRYGGAGSGIWTSTDGGTTWTRLSTGLPSGDLGRIGLAVAPSAPDVVYAVINDPTGYAVGTFRSSDRGASWTRLPAASSPSYGWFFGQVRVDPTDWRKAWNLSVRLDRTLDGGQDWFGATGTMHVDQHALWIDPANPDRMIAGNDGGVYRNVRGTSTLDPTWTKTPGRFPVTQFYTVEIDAIQPERLYGGTQDNGTNRTLTGAVDDWEKIGGADGQYVLVDPVDNDVYYVSTQYGGLIRRRDSNGFFTVIVPPDAGRKNWSTPVVMAPSDPSTLYYGAQRVWKTTDRGLSWTAISPDLTGGPGPGDVVFGTLSTLGASPADPARLWAGTDDGRVWTTADGANWANVSAGLPTRWVTRITPHPTQPQTAVATLSGFRWGEDATHVYRTDDAGATWTALSAGLPDVPTNDVLFDPDRPDRLYLATDVGVFWSADGGLSWRVLGESLPAAPVTDLDLEGRLLVAATYGRGLYRLDLNDLPVASDAAPETSPLRMVVAPNPARGETLIRFDLPAPGEVTARVFDVRGRVVRRLSPRVLPAGARALRVDLGGLAPGAYVVRVATPTATASGRLVVVR